MIDFIRGPSPEKSQPLLIIGDSLGRQIYEFFVEIIKRSVTARDHSVRCQETVIEFLGGTMDQKCKASHSNPEFQQKQTTCNIEGVLITTVVLRVWFQIPRPHS